MKEKGKRRICECIKCEWREIRKNEKKKRERKRDDEKLVMKKKRKKKKIKKPHRSQKDRDMKREETNVQLCASEMECLTRVNTKNTRSLEK